MNVMGVYWGRNIQEGLEKELDLYTFNRNKNEKVKYLNNIEKKECNEATQEFQKQQSPDGESVSTTITRLTDKFNIHYINWRFFFKEARDHPAIQSILQEMGEEKNIHIFCCSAAELYAKLCDVVHLSLIPCSDAKIIESMQYYNLAERYIDCMKKMLHAHRAKIRV